MTISKMYGTAVQNNIFSSSVQLQYSLLPPERNCCRIRVWKPARKALLIHGASTAGSLTARDGEAEK